MGPNLEGNDILAQVCGEPRQLVPPLDPSFHVVTFPSSYVLLLRPNPEPERLSACTFSLRSFARTQAVLTLNPRLSFPPVLASSVIPVVQSLLSLPPCRAEESGVLVGPLRELVSQIYQAAKEVARLSIKSQVVFGATNVNTDVRGLTNGVDILVGTPGQLLDLVENCHQRRQR